MRLAIFEWVMFTVVSMALCKLINNLFPHKDVSQKRNYEKYDNKNMIG